MKNNKLLGVVLWFLALAAVYLIVFLAARELTAALWISYGFTMFAFASQLVLWLVAWKKPMNSKQQFLHTPVLTYSLLYLAGQTVLCLIFAFARASAKTAVLVNVLVLIAFWALMVLSLIGKNHIERIDRRQKDHHIEL